MLAFDDRAGILYVHMRQTFALWFVPLYKARVRLVTVIALEQRMSNRVEGDAANGSVDVVDHQPRWFIASQEDHYQINECLRFVLPIIGPMSCALWQLVSTLVCVFAVVAVELLCRVVGFGGRVVHNGSSKVRQ